MHKFHRVTRRRFVGAAAALAAPCIVPAAALGRGGAAPSERVTLGIIGSGGRGTSNMRAFLPLSGAQVVAVCDVRREMRERAAQAVAEHDKAKGRGGTRPQTWSTTSARSWHGMTSTPW